VHFPRSLLIAMLAIATLVATPLMRIAVAGIAWGVIECCCGEHAGDHRCGCPDCPAADHDGDPDDAPAPEDGAPGLGPCGANAEWISPVALAPFVPPARVAPVRPAHRIATTFVRPAAPAGRVVHPTVPPS
jgi:hypothetical protein